MKDVNHVVLVCRLTKDPELRSLPSGTSVCTLRVAFSTSWKNSATGQYEDRPNYCDVTVWGAQGETCARYLAKGKQVCVLGRLQWREWSAQDGSKRQALDIVAEQVQFLGGRQSEQDGPDSQDYQRGAPSSAGVSGAADIPVDSDFSSVPASGQDDDIPFLWRPVSWESAKVHVSRW